jgi:4-amino-4-deoxy-L-arabinose transferase-like glycosyltransferase
MIDARQARALALALALAAALAIRLDTPALFDDEGRYAQVAREMLATGDLVSPRLNSTLHLNKPPLLYWLAALGFAAGAPGEWVRLVALAAAFLALLATVRLGTILFDEATGLVAGVALALGAGFALEARTLRPDGWLLASVATALFCAVRGLGAEGGRGQAWLGAVWAALGLGALAKGLVPLVVAVPPLLALALLGHGRRGLGRLHPGLGAAVFAAVVLPWHVLAALRHEGFAFDYLANQHVLFFLDRKLPRDSVGDPLPLFLAIFVGRHLPWILLVPLTAREAWRGLGGDADPASRAAAVLWVWAVALLLFFSLSPSRLEHYTVPAAPAMALLAARGWRRLGAGASPRAWVALAAAGGVAVGAGVVALVAGRALLERTYWIAQAPDLGRLAPAFGMVLVAGGAGLAAAAVRRQAGALLAALGALAAPALVVVLVAHARAEAVFSWRPAARVIAALPPRARVVFEAPGEYQIVGGLAFYADRPVTVLEPPGFVPPAYLAAEAREAFLSREAFETRWRSGEPLALVTDPWRRHADADPFPPAPRYVRARFGDRWVITNFPPGGA